jgi:hypothetical protein
LPFVVTPLLDRQENRDEFFLVTLVDARNWGGRAGEGHRYAAVLALDDEARRAHVAVLDALLIDLLD